MHAINKKEKKLSLSNLKEEAYGPRLYLTKYR